MRLRERDGRQRLGRLATVLAVVGVAASCSSSGDATLTVGEALLVKGAECLRVDAPDGAGSTCGDDVLAEPWARVVGAWAYGVAPSGTAVVRAPGGEQAEFLEVEGGLGFAIRYEAPGPVTAEGDDGDVLIEFDFESG